MFKLIFTPIVTVLVAIALMYSAFQYPPGSFLNVGYFILAVIFSGFLPVDIRRSRNQWKARKAQGSQA